MGQMLLFSKEEKKKIKPELKRIFSKLNKNGFLKSYFSKKEISELLNSSGNYLTRYNQ